MKARTEHWLAGLALVVADPFFTWAMIYFTIFTIFIVGFGLAAYEVVTSSSLKGEPTWQSG